MAWAVPPRRGDTRLYQWLAQGEEEALASPHGLPWTPEQPAYDGSPERLADFRAGREVNIAASALPPWVCQGRQFNWWDRAMVGPDGTLRIVDDARAWLAENGLL